MKALFANKAKTIAQISGPQTTKDPAFTRTRNGGRWWRGQMVVWCGAAAL